MENLDTLDAVIVAAVVLAVRQGLELIGKRIPDTAEGVPGAIRKAAKTLSGYIPNVK